jgi:glycerol-3-phosphate dehydrogenase (NAD(P)+)
MKSGADIGVVGAGSWGTALACLLAEHGRPVHLWSHNPTLTQRMLESKINDLYLPDIPLPPEVQPTCELRDLRNCDVVLLVPPSKAFREVTQRLRELDFPGSTVWVSCTKGIEHDSGSLMTDLMEEILGTKQAAVLSGPNHAVEVARKIPAAAVVGAAEECLRESLQEFFNFPTFRAYSSSDVRGIQLGGALKNIYAIGAGCSDGLNMGDNAKAALVTRSLAELTRLGLALGGNKETFFGLSGLGDLMVTCFSHHSRNRRFGERLGRGESPQAILDSMNMVAEGVPTTRSAWQQARACGVDTPVIECLYQVLYHDASPRAMMKQLLDRSPKPEAC